MSVTIAIDLDTFTANVRGFEHVIDLKGWHGAGYRRVFEYGLQRIHNDACGGIKRDECADDAEYRKLCLEEAADVTAALRAGTKRARAGGGGRTADPIMREAMAIAEETLFGKMKPAQRKALDAKKVADYKRDWIARNPEVLDKAAKALEIRATETTEEVDYTKLLG